MCTRFVTLTHPTIHDANHAVARNRPDADCPMAERPVVARRDSMADKEANADDSVEFVTEDTESVNHNNGTASDRDINDVEKADTEVVPPEPLRRTVTAQDWNGPDDPENPLNW